jgi:hypothetical protein
VPISNFFWLAGVQFLGVDEFTERLARIRERFASTLNKKVDDSFASLSHFFGEDAGAIETIIVTHRRLHEICGIAPSVGFPATGSAARAAEAVLRDPAKSKRRLTVREVAAFTAQLHGLRRAAQFDLQTSSDRG